MKIKKAIFPLAGIGSRMLPITKSIPKGMIRVANKPLLQYAMEEAIASGIYDLVFVVKNQNNAIKKYLDSIIKEKNNNISKSNFLISKIKSLTFVTQKKPLGLGDAIYCTKDVINSEAFAVLLADDLIKSDEPVIKQMLNHFSKLNSSIIAISKIKMKDSNQYGILNAHQPNKIGITKIHGLIEKPSPSMGKIPSNLAIIGRYILTSDIFTYLKNLKPGYNGEIQLTDAIKKLIKKKHVYGYQYKGTRFDCGNKTGLQMANLNFSMRNSKMK